MNKPGSIRSRLFYRLVKRQHFRGQYTRYLEEGIDENGTDKPTDKQLKGLLLKEHLFEGRDILVLIRQENPNDINVIFFHGGGFFFQASSFHWEFITDFTRRTGATVYCVDYPLAPEYHSGTAYDFSMNYYMNMVDQVGNANLYLMGDSAGAGLAMSLLVGLKKTDVPMPRKAILLSPFMDVTCSDSRQKALDEVDPLLSREDIVHAIKAYTGELPLDDWRVSPINDSLEGLSPISIYTGEYDILYTDAIRLKEKLHSVGAEPAYHYEPGMIHDWMLFNMLPEAKKTRDQIAKELEV